ncbi:MAG: NADAR family protein [Myxococcales bacterium]|nr:NADAR family protein [Myxococcales bacterium]
MPTETRAGFTFFWRPDSPFSQWHPCAFTVDGHAFTCAEQFMMHGKARLFDDADVAAQILAIDDPRAHKALGRKVRGFDDHRWKVAREAIVYAGNHAKFTQAPALHAALLATAGTTLVEASPLDRIWGIGLASSSPHATVPAKWRGLNLLGQVLTRLRDDLAAAAAAG